ncbi:signal peptide peptidase SppA [Polyangium jinanense]|uniref:Signal peptide peptidase SppA n=1 Tax=Polyangium jinanense TaxID=2829994 RepID=A0A9X3X3K7_9BACT|nr:signal peptide peptidase SppA [Polyangium jinanense]MDC3980731.1 signal peptide peptidase SppA [Polyangium jinanense]
MKKLSALALGGLALAAFTTSSAPLHAQSAYVPAPGRPVAAGDDASSIAYNPANLGFLPGAELRWTMAQAGAGAGTTNGHAFDLGLPLLGLSTGLRVDLLDVSTPAGASASQRWLRWALATNLSDTFALGTTFGWSYAERGDLDEQFGVTTGLTIRPFTWLSAAVIARDWTTNADRRYDVGLALRPFWGRRYAELGLEASIHERTGDVTPRATLGLDVPRVGRLRGEVSVRDLAASPDLTAMVGLDLNFATLQAGGGAIFGGGDVGYYATAALRTYREPGLPSPKRVARIRIDSTPGVRKHVQLLRRLWRLAEDRNVDGVVLQLRAEPASSLAHAEEVGDAVRLLRASGKKVLCHLEDAGGRSLHVCAQADRIAMNPAGGLRFAGLSSQYMYYGGVLDKLGVRADFVRVAEHKLAAEQYTRKDSSEIGRQDHMDLLTQLEGIYMHDVGGGRRMPLSTLRKTIAKGPFIAPEARSGGLVDVLAYDDEIDEVVEETMGGRARIVDDVAPTNAPTWWGTPSKIAIVYLSGDMVDGESQTIPLVGIRLAGSYTIAKALKRAREDASVKAVVFRIETGGGSSLAADVILREAILTAKAKPFVVSMGTAAASGGYYASVAGGPIYANRATITGSIGIFYGKVDLVGLLGKLGVGLEQFRTAPRADAESLYRPFTEEERKELGVKVKQFYDLFIARVAEGRKMKPEDVDAVARGRVWTGQQALERKLVDHIGGLREALDDVRSRADLPHDAQLVEFPEDDDSLLIALAKLAGIAAVFPQAGAVPIVIPPALLDLARGLAPFMVYDGTKPLARLDLVGDVSFGGAPATVDDELP